MHSEIRQFLQGTCKNKAILARILQEPLKSYKKLARIKQFLQNSWKMSARIMHSPILARSALNFKSREEAITSVQYKLRSLDWTKNSRWPFSFLEKKNTSCLVDWADVHVLKFHVRIVLVQLGAFLMTWVVSDMMMSHWGMGEWMLCSFAALFAAATNALSIDEWDNVGVCRTLGWCCGVPGWKWSEIGSKHFADIYERRRN